MKVIVLDRPKVLGFFLRKIYGIKKVKDVNQ
ncbi:MAG: stage V sporulation protein SpoVM [Ruminococcus sp.]|nr:stage V sporulation protein SpoVM [Ruminococcus sp.]